MGINKYNITANNIGSIGSSISKNDIAKLDTISRNLRKMLNSKKIDMDLFEMAVEGIEFIVKTNKK